VQLKIWHHCNRRSFSKGAVTRLRDLTVTADIQYMAARISALEELEGFVRHRIEVQKFTHKKLQRELHERFPGEKGFSISSIEKFCAQKDIKRTTDIDEQHLDEVISQAVSQVI